LVRTIARWKRLDQPEAYVRKVMYHQQVSRWRLRSWGKTLLAAQPPDLPDPGDAFARSDLRLSLDAALRRLSPGQRVIVVMRFFEDLPESEVAAILGVSVGTVRTQCYRALRALRERCPELAEPEGTPS
jgi:RNA polymerase sigma factor (sigma-70 family)